MVTNLVFHLHICFLSLYHVRGVFDDVVVVKDGICANCFPGGNQDLILLLFSMEKMFSLFS